MIHAESAQFERNGTYALRCFPSPYLRDLVYCLTFVELAAEGWSPEQSESHVAFFMVHLTFLVYFSARAGVTSSTIPVWQVHP
jgi:hypothetical protein